MKKANIWIVGSFLLITVFHYADTLMTSAGRLYYLSLAYLAAFAISMFMTRKSKACNVFFLIYSAVLCVAIISAVILPIMFDSDVFSILWIFAMVLIDPFISAGMFLGGGTSLLQILILVLVCLFPFIAMAISFSFYTKNRCE